jgi:hypothetical protein
MTRAVRIRLWVVCGAFALGLGGGLIAFREPTVPLTAERLQAARQRWEAAGIGNYQLQYRMHGAAYDVVVEGGIVTSLMVNGQPAATATPQAYSVKGLFETLQQELDNASGPMGPAGIMRVRFHAELGYVERYLRTGGGLGRDVSIELTEFSRRSP